MANTTLILILTPTRRHHRLPALRQLSVPKSLHQLFRFAPRGRRRWRAETGRRGRRGRRDSTGELGLFAAARALPALRHRVRGHVLGG